MTAAYRIRQGVRALFAAARPADDRLAAEHLPPPLLALFRQMRPGEQLHSLNVLRVVLAQGEASPPLAIAALLHDVGKIRCPLAVWQKTLAVLVCAFLPAWFRRWSLGDARRFWLRPFVVYVQHPKWSAELLTQAGAPPDAIWLCEHHADNADQWSHHPLYHMLKRLQAADDAN